jgi:hypothetical protein
MQKLILSKKSKILLSSLILIILLVFSFLYFHKYKAPIQPEDLHLNGDGVYFNVFTEDTRNKESNGIFENITNDTIFYASIQNAGKSRYMQLTAYIDYKEVPLTILSDDYKSNNIYLKDLDNIIIPFKINADIEADKNYKFLISLFFGTDIHAAETNIQSNNYAMSYDFFIKNQKSTDFTFSEEEKANYSFSNFDFPSVMLNTDFNSSATGVKDPPMKITAKPGEKFDLAYRIGQIEDADKQLLIVTINYHQAKINNSNYLLVDTEEGQTSYGTISMEAPSQKGKYEICALVVPDPMYPSPFVPLENAYRFTLMVN